MTTKTKFIVIMVTLILLTACASPQPEISAVGASTCSFRYWVAIETPNGETFDLKINSTATWQGPNEDGDYVLVPDNTSEWGSAREQVQMISQRLNEGLSLLYAESEFLTLPDYSTDILPDALLWYNTPGECEWVKGQYLDNDYPNVTMTIPFDEMENSGYVTTTRIGENTTFVKVVSPMGSIVSYSYPTSYLKMVYDYALGLSEQPLKVEANLIELPTIGEPDGQEYSQAILEQALNQDSLSNEAASFTLNTEDFEGRSELRAVIAKALELSSSQLGVPSIATLHALMSNGQKEKTYATLKGGFVFFGGYLSGESSGEVWFEDVIKASVYIVPVNK